MLNIQRELLAYKESLDNYLPWGYIGVNQVLKGFEAMQQFSFSERTAITHESGKILVWTPPESVGGKVFRSSEGSVILQSDGGSWWNFNKNEAQYCFYAEYWMGEYPYGSWAWAIRLCKVSGEVSVSILDTEINSRGLTEQDIWRGECRFYVPQSVAEGKACRVCGVTLRHNNRSGYCAGHVEHSPKRRQRKSAKYRKAKILP
jgi:hypothetical protein